MIRILVFRLAIALKFEVIPKAYAPPDEFFIAGSAYDEVEHRIIFFGMKNSVQNTYDSSLYTFDVLNLEWGIIMPESNFVPNPLGSTQLFIRKDRILLSILGCNDRGFINDIFSFNLTSKVWKAHDNCKIPGLCYSASTSFTHEGKDLIAIFGGFSSKGLSKKFYLFDVWSLSFFEPRTSGEVLQPSSSESLTYLNSKLYLYGYQSNPRDEVNITYSTGLKVYDLNSQTWSLITSDKANQSLLITSHNLFTLNSKIYLVGGYFPKKGISNFNILEINPKTAESTVIFTFKDLLSVRSLSSLLVINQSFILAGGRADDRSTNEVIRVTFPSLTLDVLSRDYICPCKRKNHAMALFTYFLYIYGGEAEDLILGDLWRFDLKTSVWTSLNPAGDIPQPRIGFGFYQEADAGFFIFGGKGSIWYNDIYFYAFKANEWVTTKFEGQMPGPRLGTCIEKFADFYLLLIGGLTPSGSTDEIYVFNFFTNKIALVKWVGRETVRVFNNLCIRYNYSNSQSNIKILGGETSKLGQNIFKYKIEISLKQETFYAEVLSKEYDTELLFTYSHSSIITFSETALIFFGSFYGLYASNIILELNLKTFKSTLHEFPLFIHSQTVVHFNKSFFLFGGCMTEGELYFEKCYSNSLIKLDFEDDLKVPCSSALISETCEFCPKGTFLINNSCVPCGKGKFSDIEGLMSSVSCLPCGFGTYSSELQATQCRKCEEGFTCFIGTQRPKLDSAEIQEVSIQPQDYKSEYKDISVKITFALAPACFLAFSLFFCFQRFRVFMKKIDLFMMQHPNQLNGPVMYRSTSFGGFFTLIFVFVSCYSIIGSFYLYLMDNIKESKALVPLETIKDEIIAEVFMVFVTLRYYGGQCLSDDLHQSKLILTEQNLKFSSKIVDLSKFEENCHVNITYFNCQIINLASISIISFDDEAYCSIISVNITSNSSIPDEMSGLVKSLKPLSNHEVFRGASSSVFEFVIHPSLFISESRSWPTRSTGFHISDSGQHKIGSAYSQTSFISYPSLRINIRLLTASDALVTQRTLKFTWFLFFSNLFGSVFGILQFLGAFMALFESYWEIQMKRRKGSFKVKEVLDGFKRVKVNFESYKGVSCKRSYFEEIVSQKTDFREM